MTKTTVRIAKILVPTDFSPNAASAARFAVDLARQLDASVTLLHVQQLPVWISPDGGVLQPTAKMLADTTQRIESQLLSARQALEDGGVSLATLGVIGDAAPEIVRVADDFDLVVMGTRGRGRLAHLLVGSVAERVVRTCKRPVLTVHSPQK